jgi:threonine dehydratase
VPPYESLDVIAGQGTCGLEILDARPGVETILVPVGGGGLIAGIAAAVA